MKFTIKDRYNDKITDCGVWTPRELFSELVRMSKGKTESKLPNFQSGDYSSVVMSRRYRTGQPVQYRVELETWWEGDISEYWFSKPKYAVNFALFFCYPDSDVIVNGKRLEHPIEDYLASCYEAE